MPRRPRAHVLEEESRIAFETALVGSFIYRDESGAREYGIDGTAEHFEDEEPTGLRFLVQLKATDEVNLQESLATEIGRGTAELYRRQTLPVLMVRYRAVDRSLYARWFHQFDLARATGIHTVSFRWSTDDLVGPKTPLRLAAEAHAFLQLRSPELPTPIDVYLESDGTYGLDQAVMLMALRSAARERSDVIEIRGGSAPPGAVRILANDRGLWIDLAKVTVAAVHAPALPDDDLGEQFAIDALVAAALAFADVGRTDIATRLATGFLVRSSVAGSLDVVWGLALAFIRSHRIREALDLAHALHQSEDPLEREVSISFLLAAMSDRPSLSEDEVGAVKAEFESRVVRWSELGNELEAGRSSYTLGNFLRRFDGPASLLAYEDAVSRDRGYLDRDYFHEELAGVLFGLGRFDNAAASYARSIELGADAQNKAMRADALMFGGRYREAREALAAYLGAPSGLDDYVPEWQIKQYFLEMLDETLGISAQTRKPADALDLFADWKFEAHELKDNIRVLDEALALDALYAAGWFNRAYALYQSGDRQGAMSSYLAAAVSQRRDGEAWANVVALSMAQPETSGLAEAALQAGLKAAGDDFQRHLIQAVRAQPDDFPKTEMLERVGELLERLRPRPNDGLLIRRIDETGAIESSHIGRDARPPSATDDGLSQ